LPFQKKKAEEETRVHPGGKKDQLLEEKGTALSFQRWAEKGKRPWLSEGFAIGQRPNGKPPRRESLLKGIVRNGNQSLGRIKGFLHIMAQKEDANRRETEKGKVA